MTHVHLKYIAMVIVSIHQESINHSDQIFLVFKMEWFLQKYESHRLGGSCQYNAAAGHHTCCSYLEHCSLLHVQFSAMFMSGLSGVFLTFPHYIRDDRIYSDSIRIRIFFLESRIFGFGFENFGDRIIFEYSNLFPRISNI